MNAISLNNLWSYLQGLSLSMDNQRWLADHLLEKIKECCVFSQYIITRDKKGFNEFDIQVMTPAEFVSKAKQL